MSYDFETDDRRAPILNIKPAHHTDLEAITFLLEVAGIILSSEPGLSFSFEQLFDEAQKLAGPELILNETDVKIVLGYMKYCFHKKGKNNYRLV